MIPQPLRCGRVPTSWCLLRRAILAPLSCLLRWFSCFLVEALLAGEIQLSPLAPVDFFFPFRCGRVPTSWCLLRRAILASLSCLPFVVVPVLSCRGGSSALLSWKSPNTASSSKGSPYYLPPLSFSLSVFVLLILIHVTEWCMDNRLILLLSTSIIATVT